MTGIGEIQVKEVPLAEPGLRQALVRVEAVGVCGSDTTYFTAGRIGDYVVEGPIVLGHEVAGVVEAVGPEVTHVALGDRVAVEPGTPCRDCRECLRGRYHLCPRLEFLATPPHDGALAQRFVMDERNLFVMPEGMSFEDGAMLEPLSVGLWANQRARTRPGDNVLVTGAGPVGLLAAGVASALGAASVTVTDIAEHRLQAARRMGFTTERADIDPDARTVEFDVLLECSGASGALTAGMARLREAGRAAMVGMPKQVVELPLSQWNARELTLSLVNRYAHTWPTALALVASGRVDVRTLVTHHYALDETVDALLAAKNEPGSIKAVVHPQRVTSAYVEHQPDGFGQQVAGAR